MYIYKTIKIKNVKIDIHFERLKFLDGLRSANFVYIRKFVEN